VRALAKELTVTLSHDDIAQAVDRDESWSCAQVAGAECYNPCDNDSADIKKPPRLMNLWVFKRAGKGI